MRLIIAISANYVKNCLVSCYFFCITFISFIPVKDMIECKREGGCQKATYPNRPKLLARKKKEETAEIKPVRDNGAKQFIRSIQYLLDLQVPEQNIGKDPNEIRWKEIGYNYRFCASCLWNRYTSKEFSILIYLFYFQVWNKVI